MTDLINFLINNKTDICLFIENTLDSFILDWIVKQKLLIKKIDFENILSKTERSKLSQYSEFIELTKDNKKFSKKYIEQPFGSQKPPDFIGFEELNNKYFI